MSKEIICEAELQYHPEVALIKAYRNINLQIGTLKRATQTPERVSNIKQFIFVLHQIQKKARNLGFEIWVNENGKTGHTFEKDYRETPDELHDYNAHLIRLTELGVFDRRERDNG